MDTAAPAKLSIFRSSIAVTEYIMFESFLRGDIMRRIGVNRFWPTFPVGIYETKARLARCYHRDARRNGVPSARCWGCSTCATTRRCSWASTGCSVSEEIESRFGPKLKQRTAQEWFAEGLKRKIPIVPVPGIGDLIRDDERRNRARAIVPIAIGDETGFTAGSMQRLTGTPPRRGRAVPAIGERAARHGPFR